MTQFNRESPISMIYCCCHVSVAHLIMDSYHHKKFPCAVWESEIRLGFKIILGLAIVIKNCSPFLLSFKCKRGIIWCKVMFLQKDTKECCFVIGWDVELLCCHWFTHSMLHSYRFTCLQAPQKAVRAIVYICEIPSCFGLPQILWIPAVMCPVCFCVVLRLK